jgi:NADH-quinone oxidoreductase subunit L
METTLLCYILFFPLLGFFINGLVAFFRHDLETACQRYLGWSEEHFFHRSALFSACIGVGVIVLSFLAGICGFVRLIGMAEGGRVLTQTLFPWIHSGSVRLDFALQFDALSAIMVLVVTGVGSLIHIYSVGYMHGDKGFCRYFAYLNLFIFAMLTLVLGKNLLVLFIGWEGVGLASYLLIGFWFTDAEKARAGKKAFITNRVGDFGFILGALLLFALFGTLDCYGINQAAHAAKLPSLYLNLAALLLFVGACGKSAQIPLYVWLPDAMAGPTPVSALIHAATMVTAGVYMVARMSALYFAAPIAMSVVAIIGAATAIFAATIGLVQTDIKKVLAYSTVSQLGYMFLACGVGAPILAIFHLVTHAFFKACLFLGAGSVIHGMGGEQDITKMGGLKHKMPVTCWTFFIATLAIAGFPPLSGFVSKDEILFYAFASKHGSVALWGVAALAALCTSFYMFRLFYLTFLGENRSDHHVYEHVHESPATMKWVLVALAFLSVVGGIIAVPHTMVPFHMPNYLEHWLGTLMHNAELTEAGEHLSSIFIAISVIVAFLGLGIAHAMYGRKSDLAAKMAAKAGCIYRLVLNKYWIDELYTKYIYTPIYKLSETILFQVFDKKCIDGSVNGSGKVCQKISRIALKMQQGDMQFYLLYMVVGLLVLSAVIFFNVVK